MIDPKAAEDYFENLASLHPDILHEKDVPGKIGFHSGDELILLNDIAGNNSTGFVVMFEHGSGQLFGNDVSLFDKSEGSLSVCKIVTEGDYAMQKQVLKDCKRILKDLLAKMKYDRDHNHTFLKDFELPGIRYQMIYGFGNNHFGYRMVLDLNAPVSIVYNPALWSG